MEAINHFSHNHGLVFHQISPDQVSHTLCSGCKSPASGNVYVCWQCSYFLHEQCFCATWSLSHPSHPLHPLTLMPFPTYPSRSFICNSCNLIGDAFSYTCSQCEFDIHVHCAHDHMPNPINPHNFNSQPNAAILIKHFSHLHVLKQVQINQNNAKKACSACDRQLIDFAYSCAACSYDLHIDCVKWPETVTRPDHEHSLTLYCSSPYAELGEEAIFVCSVCMRPSHKNSWVYYCGVCDFGTHLECVHSEIKNSELSRLLGQNEKMNLDEIMQMARQKKKSEEEEYVKKMEMEAELRRRRHNLAMQRLQQASDSIDLLGRII